MYYGDTNVVTFIELKSQTQEADAKINKWIVTVVIVFNID